MKFGSREICDVVFKAAANNQKVGKKYFKAGQPVFHIDTAKTSSVEQGTATVYAQGGKGFNRLISWEGEKTMTFTVEDALISPQGLAVLSGAGIAEASATDKQHFHVTYAVAVDTDGKFTIKLADLIDELGLAIDTAKVEVCTDVPVYGTVLDGSGAGIDYVDSTEITLPSATNYIISVTSSSALEATITNTAAKGKTVMLDFYVLLAAGVTEINIEPSSFGGYFYVEADTLYRREDNGKDMAASITFPKVKVQSAFNIAMSASGDPSTFNFTMDAMPGYTYFDKTKKTCCVIQIVGTDGEAATETSTHANINKNHTPAVGG